MRRRSAAALRQESVAEVPAKSRTKRPGRRANAVARALSEVLDRFVDNKEGDWSEATPTTWLGLYVYLHRGVYKVSPDDLADEWYPAFSSAKRAFEKDFGGSATEMVNFMRWSWRQIAKRHRRASDDDDFRMTWRYQFSRKLIVGYKVALNRK
jgi:hypothetical protein